MRWILTAINKLLIAYLSAPSEGRAKKTTNSPELLYATVKPGDVILVEGKQRFSTFIKYLTQSNWSHAAIYVGPRGENEKGEILNLLEADLEEGVRIIPLSEYGDFHTRICRPRNLGEDDLEKIIEFCSKRIGYKYDIRNIIDLARYLFPIPWVPTRFKKEILRFGSADSTQVICSSLIAEAFQSIRYPIMPIVETVKGQKIHQVIHASFFTPSDFDRSPYFEIVKPTYSLGFEYKEFVWMSQP